MKSAADAWQLQLLLFVAGEGRGLRKGIEQAGNEVRMEHHEFRRIERESPDILYKIYVQTLLLPVQLIFMQFSF